MKSNGRRARVLEQLNRPAPLTTGQVLDLEAESFEAEQRLAEVHFPLSDLLIYLAGRRVRRYAPIPEAPVPTPELDEEEAAVEVALAQQMVIQQRAEDVSYVGWAAANRAGTESARRHAQALTETAKLERAATQRLRGKLVNLQKSRDAARRAALLAQQAIKAKR